MISARYHAWKAAWLPDRRTTRELLELIVFSRVALVLAGWVGMARLPWKYYSPEFNVSANPAVLMWIRWDGLWYTGIAAHGYWFQALAFFPLYPLLTAALHWVTRLSVFDTALIVSNLGLVGFVFAFYGLVRDVFNAELAKRSVWIAILFPTAFFMSAAYTEGIFMFLSIAVFWTAYRKKFYTAGIFGMLAALTRNEGAFTVIPILWSYYQSYGWKIKKSLWSVLLVPSGIIAYMIYQWRDFGSPFAFIAAQAYWGRQISFPWVGIILAIRTIWNGSPLQTDAILSMIDLSAAIAFMLLWVLAWRRKFPPDWLTYWGVLLLIDISAPDIHGRSPLLSMSRLVLILFPGFVMMGILAKHESWQRLFGWVFPMLQMTFFLIFATWHWIA
jgi:Gpi18-like mannosyltransferase